MPIDFTLNDNQQRLRREARQFAKDVLSGVAVATRDLPSPIERFVATRPFYERLVTESFLRKCIPVSVGGDCAGLVDLAILAEEFYTVDPNVSLTMLSTMLGLTPLVVGGTPDQHQRFLQPFLATKAAPLAAFALTEPGGSANVGSPSPGEGVRTTARRVGDSWVISGRKQWISAATGWNGEGANLLTVVCRTDANVEPSRGISIIAVPRPDSGLIFEHAFDMLGLRAHLTPRFRLEAVQISGRNLNSVQAEARREMGTVSQHVECVLKNQAAVGTRYSDDRDTTRGFDVGIGAADDGEQVGTLSVPSGGRRYPLLPARDDPRVANSPRAGADAFSRLWRSDVGAAAGFGRSECGKRCTLGRKKGRQKPLVLIWRAANHQRRKPEHRGEHGE